MKKQIAVCLLALALAPSAFAKGEWYDIDVGVAAVVGTLGPGLTITLPINSVLNARIYGAGLGFGVDVNDEDLNYDGDLTIGGIGPLLDYHPFSNGFRASAGFLYTFNEFDGTAHCNQAACDVGDAAGVILPGDRVDGNVDYSGFAPYAGLGWGNAVAEDGRWTFSFDIGALFTGSPDVSIQCRAGLPASQTACQQEADNERDDLKDEIGDYKIYPVVSLGVGYRF